MILKAGRHDDVLLPMAVVFDDLIDGSSTDLLPDKP
jgi:hypothetical protein